MTQPEHMISEAAPGTASIRAFQPEAGILQQKQLYPSCTIKGSLAVGKMDSRKHLPKEWRGNQGSMTLNHPPPLSPSPQELRV